MMRLRFSARVFFLAPLGLGLIAGVLCLSGCGEREARLLPMESAKRDEVDKGLNNPVDNPYGAEIKVQPKVKAQRSAGGKTRRD